MCTTVELFSFVKASAYVALRAKWCTSDATFAFAPHLIIQCLKPSNLVSFQSSRIVTSTCWRFSTDKSLHPWHWTASLTLSLVGNSSRIDNATSVGSSVSISSSLHTCVLCTFFLIKSQDIPLDQKPRTQCWTNFCQYTKLSCVMTFFLTVCIACYPEIGVHMQDITQTLYKHLKHKPTSIQVCLSLWYLRSWLRTTSRSKDVQSTGQTSHE